MRLTGILCLTLLVVFSFVSPVAAQPKVTITGFIDHVSSWANNTSHNDLNLARKDSEWYARSRTRPDIVAEVGTTKFVLGIEIDYVYGQTGATDVTAPLRFGASAGADLNTDLAGIMEIKWAYTEFDVPLVPFKSRMRLGAQPHAAMYKDGVYATGDYSGVNLVTQWTPMVRSHLSLVQFEEASTGPKDTFIRGDDIGIIASVEITPFKGLDIRPIFSYLSIIGVTSASARQNRGGLGAGAAVFPTCPGTTGPGTGGCLGGGISSAEEHRYTIGVDARWRIGPFYVDPTVLYQFGNREQISPTISLTSGPGVMTGMRRDAWYVDLRGGWQAGPLLIEALGLYTTGNKARDRIDLNRNRLKFFEPLSTDNGAVSGFTEMQGGGQVDYNIRIRAGAGSLNPGVAIGYDKYGLIVAGVRASYALTPNLTFRGLATARWTAEAVDTASAVAAGTGLTPRCAAAALDAGTCTDQGTSQFYGSEFALGLRWRFAPNVTFDMAGSYFVAGNALSSPAITNVSSGVVQDGRDPKDVQTVSMRVRYSF
jgi:hypothetical protein